MKQYFHYEDTPYKPGYYIVKINHDTMPITGTLGSCNVLMARIFNLSYAEFLRMCRDKFNATIIGKGTIYGMPYFKPENLDDLKELVRLLNQRTDAILKSIE